MNLLFVSYPRNAANDIYSIVTWLSKKTNYAQTTRIQMQNWKKTVFNILIRSIVIEYDLFKKWVLYTCDPETTSRSSNTVWSDRTEKLMQGYDHTKYDSSLKQCSVGVNISLSLSLPLPPSLSLNLNYNPCKIKF